MKIWALASLAALVLTAGGCAGANRPAPVRTTTSSHQVEPPNRSSTSGFETGPWRVEPEAPSELKAALQEPVEATAQAPAPAEAPDAPAELPRGTTVLHVGDSFAAALGPELNRLFKAAGIRGVLRYKTSSYIPTWAWDKELGAHLRQYKPDLVLVTLGANELKIPDPEARIATIRRLTSRFGDRPCVWIAPPLWEAAEKHDGGALLEVIREHCAPCAYMDTNRLMARMDRAKDDIHPSPEARGEWAKVVYAWLARHRRTDSPRAWELLVSESGAD